MKISVSYNCTEDMAGGNLNEYIYMCTAAAGVAGVAVVAAPAGSSVHHRCSKGKGESEDEN